MEIKHRYGEFPDFQIEEFKRRIRGEIFYLLLLVDPKTNKNYDNVNVEKAFGSLLSKISGFNSLLFYPVEVVTVLSLLEEALTEYENPDFSFKKYRKLVLDAGAEVLKIKERD